jgi:hypothetical protein
MHSGSRLNRKEITKFRIPASAKILDEFNGSCARRWVTGVNSGRQKRALASMVVPAKSAKTVFVSFKNLWQALGCF